MKYSNGDIVRKLGSTVTYTVAATKEEPNDHDLKAGFDYLIRDESDGGDPEAVFEEDIER